MRKELDMTVNRLPARTWNWLRMNESRLEQISVGRAVQAETRLVGSQVSWRQTDVQELGETWSKIETGMGPDMDCLGELAGENVDVIETEAASDGSESSAVVDLNCKPGDGSFNRLYLHAGENSALNVTVVCRGERAAENPAALQVRVRAEKNASVRLYVAQLFNEDAQALCDIGAAFADGASLELVKLELGAGKLWAGGLFDLAGKKSSVKVKIGYSAADGQRLDMNYTARHRGKKSESLMEADGVLGDGAFKLFRGTIDFLPGCPGSKGTESENVLLLGDDLVNQTIPLILCGEEDVEGNHGASMGKLDDHVLFYMASRGIPQEEAERIIARAKLDAVCELIPDESVRELAQECLNEKEERA